MEELKREFGSHLTADLGGWDFTATYGEVMAAIHATAFLNANRDEKTNPRPFTLPMPWPDTPDSDAVTPEELADLREQLKRRSAFRT